MHHVNLQASRQAELHAQNSIFIHKLANLHLSNQSSPHSCDIIGLYSCSWNNDLLLLRAPSATILIAPVFDKANHNRTTCASVVALMERYLPFCGLAVASRLLEGVHGGSGVYVDCWLGFHCVDEMERLLVVFL